MRCVALCGLSTIALVENDLTQAKRQLELAIQRFQQEYPGDLNVINLHREAETAVNTAAENESE